MSQKRKLWTQESMETVVQSVQQRKRLREASRLYNVPVETLWQRVTGKEGGVGLPSWPSYSTNPREREKLSVISYKWLTSGMVERKRL